MNAAIKFTEKDFEVFRKFQVKMNTFFGESAYVGTDSAVVLLEYSPVFKSMLRPYPQNVQYDFEVKLLACKGCKKTAMFVSTPEENEYVCNNCVAKSKK